MSSQEAKPAVFSLKEFHFIESHLKSFNTSEEELNITFHPSGSFTKGSHIFNLVLDFQAELESSEELVIHCIVQGTYKFKDELNSIEDIPEYFYANSIAILFPYLRSFVSTLTSLSNRSGHILLPTFNLSGLKDTLQNQIAVQG